MFAPIYPPSNADSGCGGRHKAHQEEVADLTHTIEAVNKATEVLEGHYAASASMAEIKQEVTLCLF